MTESAATYLWLFLGSVIGFTFVFAGLLKLIDQRSFQRALVTYQLLPAFAVSPVAWLVPSVEIAAGVALIIGVAAPWATVAVIGLLVAFTAATAVALARGRDDLECGCFGSRTSKVGAGLFLRNAMLAGVCLGLLLLGQDASRWTPFGAEGTDYLADYFVVVLLAATATIGTLAAPAVRDSIMRVPVRDPEPPRDS